ncbi:MAG: SGNH/GDSL hydrolase family protein [Oscillospiraceae bacterium]|nr:SGNH/GDSL hydrolase family protein [Oscillospiraceae bacterium]
MRNHKIIAIILVCLLMCSLTACGPEPIKIVPKDTTGTIETAEGIFIDSESMTLTFGQGSYVICGEDRYDVSGTVHDIAPFLDKGDVYLHPTSMTFSLVDAYGNVHLGTLSDPVSLSRLNITSGQMYVDDRSINTELPYLEQPLICIGDSMTAGSGTTKAYYKWLPQLCGFGSGKIYGLNGSSIAPKTESIPTWDAGIESFLERYETMADDAAVVIVFGCANDWATSRELGTSEDTQSETFYGAMDQLCRGLKAKYPSSTIVFFSSPQNNYVDCPAYDLSGTEWEDNTEGYNRKGYKLTDYAKAMEEVCGRHDLPFCSLTEALPWGAEELGDANGKEGTLGVDGLHPNEQGHILIAEKMAEFINALYTE